MEIPLMVARKADQALSLEYSQSTSTLKLSGELDMSNVGRLREAFEAHTTPGGIVLDFSELTFMDSSGLQEILSRALTMESGVIAVRNASPMIRKLFHMTGVERVPSLVLEPEDESVKGAVRPKSAESLEDTA